MKAAYIQNDQVLTGVQPDPVPSKAHPHWSAPLEPGQGRGVAGAF